MTVVLGDSVKIDCSALGYPTPSVRIYRDGATSAEVENADFDSMLVLWIGHWW
ncbi:hypothetical protein BIW11_03040 [Tropilaelaps mercedesae]|uniref:Uncharacterized protein n=1 Tax=Tropilaelaps mercedesae TaxID=418985 RepID=A0A1V9XT86_9ACAR|nr:hypothetical protein BIW11_03040 [Tropilaelaps mercedesae]